MTGNRPFSVRFWLALAAVIIGNTVYFAMQRLLPARGHHDPFRIDLGLLVDFWVCAVVFSILLVAFRSKH